jgi:hypothetical protein
VFRRAKFGRAKVWVLAAYPCILDYKVSEVRANLEYGLFFGEKCFDQSCGFDRSGHHEHMAVIDHL